MVKKVKLNAAKREDKKASDLRNNKLVPAIVYSSGDTPTQIQVVSSEIEKILAEGHEAALIDLNLGAEDIKVIIKDVQIDPVKGNTLHVDFYAVNMKQEVNINIPINFVGIAPGVKDHGGILNINRESLDINCLPGDIVESIDVDLTVLTDMDSAINVNDITLPSGITLASEENDLIANLVVPKKQEEPEIVEESTEEGEGEDSGEEAEKKEGDSSTNPEQAEKTDAKK
jgi:large subunit ribosomal protein L25